MKRKLINFDVFKKIQQDSLSTAEVELTEAQDVLARALGIDHLGLNCFGESDVTYETADHSYVHATYQIKGNNIFFENIEELVIDESTAKQSSRQILTNVVDALLKDNGAKANQCFEEFLSLPMTRKGLMEGAPAVWVEKGNKAKKKRGPQPEWVVNARVAGKKRSQGLLSKSQKDNAKREKKSLKNRLGSGVNVHYRFKKQEPKKASKMVKEWSSLVENVNGYLDYQEFGPVMRESEVQHDEKGNVVAVRIPTTNVRNENKILTFNWKLMNTDLKILRGKMKTVSEETAFCRAMADLRKCNRLSDSNALSDVLEAVVLRWPHLVYLTQTELAEQIAHALDTMGISDYDDQTCTFMAEGILRTATEASPEKVNRIVRQSGVEVPAPTEDSDVYETFQQIVAQFYPVLDESQQLEMQVFTDLYNTLVDVHKLAHSEGNEALRSECSGYLKELHAVIKQESEPTLELAADVTTWLATLVESNVARSSETWPVSNSPSMVYPGDHPDMAKIAKVDGDPARHPGEWGDPAPVSDGKSYRGGLADEMRHRSWGNWNSEDTWPGLKNPYTPKPFGDYKMKGEKSAVDDGQSDWSRWQSKDTWPALQNPYVPDSVLGRKAMTPQNYKMKSDNLIVDK